MAEPYCANCRNEGWVCEDHLTESMGHGGCGGAGVPCPACNPLASNFRQLEHRIAAIERQLEDLCGYAPPPLVQLSDEER